MEELGKLEEKAFNIELLQCELDHHQEHPWLPGQPLSSLGTGGPMRSKSGQLWQTANVSPAPPASRLTLTLPSADFTSSQ